MIKLSTQANKPALYCILGVFMLILIVGSLDLWGINIDTEIVGYCKTFLFLLLPLLGYWAAIQLPNPKGIKDVTALPNTQNVRVRFYLASGFIDRNNQISFVRFFFDQKAIYMYFSNLIRIYEGPFFIKSIEEAEIGMFYIHSISEYLNGEVTLDIKPKNVLDPSYKLILRNLSEIDYDLIKNNINAITKKG